MHTESWSQHFPAGQLTVVLGRNGAGKTSLCRAIAGLPSTMACRITDDGKDQTRIPPRLRDTALVFQDFVNYPSLSVFDNVASPLRARGLATAEIRSRVETIAARLGLAALLDRRPHELSGGEQQRVAIGRALAKGARVLLLDEPFVNLDYKLREQLTRELRSLALDGHTAVIYTTSDPHEALTLADQVVLLHKGKVIQSGPPFEVYRAPRSFVAADLLSDPGVNRVPRGQYAKPAAIRPDHLRLQPRDGDVRFDGRVLLTETNGSETFLHVAVAGEEWVARIDGLHRPPLDSDVALYVAQQDVLELADG